MPPLAIVTKLTTVGFLLGGLWLQPAAAQGEGEEEEEAAGVTGGTRGGGKNDEKRRKRRKKQPKPDDVDNATGDDDDDDDDDDGDDDGDGDGDGDTAGPGAEVAPLAPADKGAKQKAKKRDQLRVRGRVFVRNTTFKIRGGGSQWQNELTIASARAGLDVRKYGWLRGSLEIDFADRNPDLKDVMIAAEVHDGVTVQLGNFKRPISPIALEGLWNLPLIERGLLADRIATATFDVPLNLGGRSLGAMVTYEGASSINPRFDIGIFAAKLAESSGGGADLGDQADNLVRDVYVRAQIEPLPGFSVGGTFVAFTQARFANDLRTRLLGSLDITLTTERFRVWLEGFAGRTPFFDGVESVGGLTALRLLGAPRFDKPLPWVRRIEPFVAFSAMDPSDERQDNRAIEIGGGVAVQFRKQVRLQLEYTHNAYDDEFPQSNFSFADRNTIRLQFGVRLR